MRLAEIIKRGEGAQRFTSIPLFQYTSQYNGRDKEK